MSKVSIITINYNNASGLEKTIESIVNQNFADFEYIVIDGASTDGSTDVIKKYSEKINYWVSEPDSGIYNAMNKGIRQAKGEYLLFINSGDTLYNNEVLADVFKYSLESDLIYGDLHRIFPNGETDIVKMPDYVGVDLMMQATLTHPTTFIKRELFDRYGLYREDLKIVSDWAFFLQVIVFANTSRTHLPVVVASFDMDGLSSQNNKLVQEERQRVINESFSYELYEMYYTYGSYKNFYNNRLFRLLRSVKKNMFNAFSLQFWSNYIHEKRIHPLIWCFNKTARKQKRDPLLIPVIIINYNRLADLKELVSFLQERKHENIVIVDNCSTYPPLLEYYKQIKGEVTVEMMTENYGHLVFWKNQDLYKKYSSGYYIVTDSDILPNQELPKDYINQLVQILDKHKEVSKVGFALRIDDIPDFFKQKEQVLRWESKFWKNSIGKNLYKSDIDTTFAVYPPHFKYSRLEFFYPGIRVAGDFTAKHMGWYIDSKNLSPEELFYFETANSSNSWKLDDNGNFVGYSPYLKDSQ